MDKLLSFTPEPFPELDREAEDYEFDPLAGEWETEEEDDEVRGRRRPQISPRTPRRYVKKPGLRRTAQPRLSASRLKPRVRLPKLALRPLPVPAIRPVPIPFVPPLWVPRPGDYGRPNQAGADGRGPPSAAEPSSEPASEHVRWVQDCLNRALGLSLRLDGVMGRETRSAVRIFQERRGLTINGLVGPETEEALKSACSPTSVSVLAQGSAPTAANESEMMQAIPCTSALCNRRTDMKYQLSFEAEPLALNAESPEFETLNLDIADYWQSENEVEKPYCFFNRAGDCVTLWGTDPNDAVSPWRLRNWQNPKWSIIGMKYCGPGRCKCRTIFDASAQCPAIQKETGWEEFDNNPWQSNSRLPRNLLHLDSAIPDKRFYRKWGDGVFQVPENAGFMPPNQRFAEEVALAPMDSINPNDGRIDVRAKFALRRMRDKNPAMRDDGLRLIRAINGGELAGIFGDDLGVAAKAAARLGTTRMKLVPTGEDAVLVLDKDAPTQAIPTAFFRGDTPDISKNPARLDAALQNVSKTFGLWQSRRLIPCTRSTHIPLRNVVPPGYCESGAGTTPSHPCESYAWIQSCLNRVMGTKLAITGVPDPQTRSALRIFTNTSASAVSTELESESPVDARLRSLCGGPDQCDRVKDDEDTGLLFQYIFGLKTPSPNISAALTRAVGLPCSLAPPVTAHANNLDDLTAILAQMPGSNRIRTKCPDLSQDEIEFIRKRIDGLQLFINQQKQYTYPASISSQNQKRRRTTVCTAICEIGKVRIPKTGNKIACHKDTDGFCYGWCRLDYYYRCAYGSQQQTTKNGAGTDWCGIFVLWAVRLAGKTTNDWCTVLGRIFPQRQGPDVVPGDVGYISHGQHMNIVVASDGNRVYTIDGNSMDYGRGRVGAVTTLFAGGNRFELGCVCLQVRQRSGFHSFYDPDKPLGPTKECPRSGLSGDVSPVTYPFSV